MICDPSIVEHEEPGKSERCLLQRVLRGDRRAEQAFVERFVPVVEGCVRRLGRSGRASAEDLEDMIGDVWVLLWENDKHRLRCFNPSREVRVSTWIGVLARNCCIDYLRGLRRRASPDTCADPVDGSPLPPEALEQHERVELARCALDRLDEEDREFIHSLCIDEQETQAIAERYGIALATVYSRRFKIAAKLAREVQRLEETRAARHVAAA
jgi:RNA polymerase sigma factor (sigma-70 family)